MTRFLSCIKTAVVAAAMGGGALAAQAADPVDFGTLVPGETYSFPAYTEVSGEYTPSVTGPVRIFYSTSLLALYTSPDHSSESQVNASHSYVDGGQMMSYTELTAGTTYYLYSNMTLMDGTFKIMEGKTDLEVTRVSPDLKDDELFSVSSNYTIDVGFNTPVTLSNALLIVNGTSKKVTYTVTNSSVSCDVATPIMDMYHDGLLKEGDTMTLRLVRVADALDENNRYGDNGKLEIDFKMAAKPAELVEIINASQSDVNNPFMSYYATGDEAGIISFVFDEPLAKDGSVAKITYGDADNIEVGIYVEEVPGVNTGNTAAFNFCGKLRRPIDMLPASTSATQPSNLHILFSNIRTEDGQRVYTARMANPSGYSMSFRITTLQYTISSDFTPGRGSKLKAGQEMEIWVMNGAYIHSSGIRFDYVENGDQASITVPMSQVKVETDPISDTDMIYTFAVPALNADEDTPVTVTFADAECADGLDHSKELTAEFGYDTTGVENIAADSADDSVTVFNAAGVCVLRNADRSQLLSLPGGLYIVNGKKHIVK